MVFILGANQTTLTPSSSFFFYVVCSPSLSPCIFCFNVFSLDVCWNGAGRHYSCQHSVSLPLLKSFTENQTFFFSLNVAMELTFFCYMFIFTQEKNLINFGYIVFLFTFFPWLRNIRGNVSMRHCELAVIPFLAFPIADSKWGWVRRGGVTQFHRLTS